MTIPFQELSGSPEEQYTSDGFTAVRKFLVPWDNRDSFVAWLRGSSDVFGSRETVAYPNHADILPWKIDISPYDDLTVKKSAMSTPSAGVNAYSGFALITVYYRLMTQQDLDSGPKAESGTRLTYRMNYQLEALTLNGVGLYWNNTTASLGSSREVIKQIPLTEHVLIWKQVLFPPWNAMRNLQGKVNSTKFLDCPEGTLLYEGVGVNKLYRSDLNDGASDFCWQLEYRFLQRIIYQNENKFGWNAAWRSETGLWEDVVMGADSNYTLNSGAPLYQSGDFNALFVSEMP